MTILWPLNKVEVTGQWANSPDFYAQFGQIGHNGIDMRAAVGTPVYATDAGTVVAEGWGQYDNWMGSIAGVFVRIQHWWGYSAYAHLSRTIVDVGQKVSRGQKIGLSGATGVGTGPHLHFETFPPYPNFGNGFAGRVNPRSWGLEARSSSSTPSKPKPKPKPTDRRNPVKYISGVNRPETAKARQQITGAKPQWVYVNDKRHSAVAAGKGYYSISGIVDVVGKPGTRVIFDVYRTEFENGRDTKKTFVDRVDFIINESGRSREQLVVNLKLAKSTNKLRYLLRIDPNDEPIQVVRYSWRGYKWDL